MKQNIITETVYWPGMVSNISHNIEKGISAELILGFEGTNTGYTGNAFEDILNICSVHPIREDTQQELLEKNKTGQDILKKMLNQNLIQKAEYKSKIFYIRKFMA